MMKKKTKSQKLKGIVEKSKSSTDKDTNLLDQQVMESSPNSLNEEAAAGSFEEQYFATGVYDFREKLLVDAWPELKSAVEKHGLCLSFHRDKRYIAISTTPWTRDPDIFDMAKEFIELLAKSNVSPSMAIQILNGEVIHDYVLVGHQQGGLCLKHGITKEQFSKRWKLFTDMLKDADGLLGVNLYINGNTIVAVGHSLPCVKVIRHYVEACIVDNMKPASLLKRMKVVLDTVRVQMKLGALSI
ncbi:hypothetical protein M0R45_020570 [Rubus argutus]|uniref:KRR-R motif-containing protein 1 n=1 Tax=Rubus argutus TaxID=59490 RepID=A0AAW1X9M5_RUBAR